MPETILDRTKRLLAQDLRTNQELAEQASVGYHWLRKLRLGIIKNPGVQQLERLHRFLTTPFDNAQ